jgi:tRNA A-37 threonylcarbamoyl transferase component Bud32/tetratricopeptide (TPR) repeat protein
MSEQRDSAAGPGSPIKEITGRIGKYEVIKPLGKGAMGIVYLAHDTVLDRDVALKVMVSQIADDPELKQRFEREARAVAKMTHPNVVTVFDLGSHTDGSPYIAMELLKGQDLQKAMRQPMTLERKVAVLLQVLSGLSHAHQAGIVHRDIKPANIFINLDGSVKIMDFGVARLTTASMTGTGNIVGTADYMSPEQVKGARVDGRSDVFSVGCMLYELLTGRRPFHSDNLMAIFYKITHEEPDYGLVPEGPDYEALLPVVRKSLAKEVDDRYQTAYDFAVDLREYLRTYATSSSGAHLLEDMLEEAPPGTLPEPIHEIIGPTVVTGGTLDTGSSGARPTASRTARPGTAPTRMAPTLAGTAPPAAATARGGAPTVLVPGPARAAGRPVARPAGPAPVAERQTSPLVYAAIGALVVAIAGVGAYLYLRPGPVPSPSPTAEASTAPASVPTPPPETTSTPTAPPPTLAPPPTFAQAQGKGASAIRAAQAAFSKGEYDKALAQAQAALREDPESGDARKVAESALAGQKAEARFRAAEAALGRADYQAATNEAEAGRALAPWDSRGSDLVVRIRDAQGRAQQQAQQREQQQRQAAAAAQVSSLLTNAENAFREQKFDAAIALYDQVLILDPTNQRAGIGKANALGAKAMSQAAASAGARISPGKSFVAGKTTASSIETRTASAVPEGFEESAGVVVKRGTQAAELPGKVVFDVDPDQVKPGDKYTIRISLLNEGNAPIAIADMTITTTINGRSASGPFRPQAAEVAPRQKTLLASLPDVWKEEITAFSMEVVVRTRKGEAYKNLLSWK